MMPRRTKIKSTKSFTFEICNHVKYTCTCQTSGRGIPTCAHTKIRIRTFILKVLRPFIAPSKISCYTVYRFPHSTYPYSSCICSFLQQHRSYFLFIKKKCFLCFSCLGCYVTVGNPPDYRFLEEVGQVVDSSHRSWQSLSRGQRDAQRKRRNVSVCRREGGREAEGVGLHEIFQNNFENILIRSIPSACADN